MSLGTSIEAYREVVHKHANLASLTSGLHETDFIVPARWPHRDWARTTAAIAGRIFAKDVADSKPSLPGLTWKNPSNLTRRPGRGRCFTRRHVCDVGGVGGRCLQVLVSSDGAQGQEDDDQAKGEEIDEEDGVDTVDDAHKNWSKTPK